MTEDESNVLDEISRFARQQEAEERRRFDERWRQLAAGTISAEDDAALRQLAEESEEARLDYEALRPLEPEVHQRLLDRWQAAAPERSEPQEPAPPSIAAWRRRPSTRWLALAASIVAAVVGWTLLRGPAEDLPGLPGYLPELSGEVRDIRSPEPNSELPVFAPGSSFRLLLRPERPIDEDLERRYYLEDAAGELRPWRVDRSLSAAGTVEIEGTLGEDLALEPGDWTLIYVYGRPGRLPEPEDLEKAEPGGDWGIVRVPFRVAAEDLASSRPDLEVEFAGCLSYFADRTCLPGGSLTLWVPAGEASRVAVRLGDRELEDAGIAVDGGRRFTVAATPEDGVLEVRVATAAGEESWTLELVDRPRPAWLAEAQQLFAGGEPEAARQLLEGRDGDAEPLAAALAHGVHARVLMRLGAPEEDLLPEIERAIELHRQLGDRVNLARDTAVALYLDFRRQRFSSALERLDGLARALPPGAPWEATFNLVHNRVILERKLGNFRRALELVQQEIALTRRIGRAGEQRLAEEVLALVLQDLGRFDEADALLQAVEATYPRASCSRVRLLNNRAWVLIRAADPALGDPLPILEDALAIAEREGCNATRQLDVLLDRARVLVERDEVWEGLRTLERAAVLAEHATPLQRLWWEQTEGELALRGGQAGEALERFARLEELAAASAFPEGRWLAKLGQARAHRALEDPDAALAALEEAETLLGEHSLQVPLHAGRGRFLAQRETAARFHLETLLQQGRAADALAVARRSRARLVRDLHHSRRLARLSAAEESAWNREIEAYLRLRAEIETAAAEDWRLSTEGLEQARAARAGRRDEAFQALDRAFTVLESRHRTVEPPPRPGEAVLLYHPLPQGWVGFAATGGRVESHRFELTDATWSDPEALARLLLEPFRQTLESARRVRILPFGRLNEVDFHALPWDGEILLAARPVVYGLDLGGRETSTGPRRPRQALVVADARGDLPAAQLEGAAVAAALAAAPAGPWNVVHLEGPEATSASVREQIAGFHRLHYAGHGAFAGPFGWDSALLLAGEGRLTLGDVLALDRAPTEVILSSCESARTASDGAASLGLAQAFLVAGAERVIAAVRPVGDRTTERFFRDLYLRNPPAADLAESLRRAQLSWRQRDPAADWASFRLLEP